MPEKIRVLVIDPDLHVMAAVADRAVEGGGHAMLLYRGVWRWRGNRAIHILKTRGRKRETSRGSLIPAPIAGMAGKTRV